MISIDISVVIGFRNWGAQRIKMSAQSILASFGPYKGEVIISDYGSDDPAPVKEIAETLGLKYVYTAGDPVWSRSRALNAGFSVAEGKVLVSTDADMLFSPDSFKIIYETIATQPNSALFLQCRDLPSDMSAEALETRTDITWDELEAAGRLRPRWGMGGMMAISRTGMNAVRGFDERLHTYGGEDLDFALRARRAGYKTVWIDDPNVRMYHMWHPSSRAVADQSPEGRAAVEFNKNVVYNDTTTLRNTLRWNHRLPDATPLVTVAMSTFNRADLIGETIQSVLMQTMQDFELVIVDDGSTDNTKEIIDSFNDPRIRYIYQENAGISAARNHIIRESKGLFTAVIDSDDLIHPRRLEWQLQALSQGLDGTVGAFINFDNSTGAHKLFYSLNPTQNQLSHNRSTPGHGTWLVRTSILKAINYDETITSGVDHNIFLRLIRSGAKFQHIGKPVLLRRIHDGQITSAESDKQENSAVQSWRFYKYTINSDSRKYLDDTKPNTFYAPADKAHGAESLLPYLPDHLVTRNTTLKIDSENIDLVKGLVTDGTKHLVELTTPHGNVSSRILTIQNATYSDLCKLIPLGSDVESVITDATVPVGSTPAPGTLGLADAQYLTATVGEAPRVDPLSTLIEEYQILYPDIRPIDIYSFSSEKNYTTFCKHLENSPLQGLGIATEENYLYALPRTTDVNDYVAAGSAHLYLTLGITAQEYFNEN
nr:glycosyltransferase family 2 protein [Rothia nasimurium]